MYILYYTGIQTWAVWIHSSRSLSKSSITLSFLTCTGWSWIGHRLGAIPISHHPMNPLALFSHWPAPSPMQDLGDMPAETHILGFDIQYTNGCAKCRRKKTKLPSTSSRSFIARFIWLMIASAFAWAGVLHGFIHGHQSYVILGCICQVLYIHYLPKSQTLSVTQKIVGVALLPLAFAVGSCICPHAGDCTLSCTAGGKPLGWELATLSGSHVENWAPRFGLSKIQTHLSTKRGKCGAMQ